MQSKLSSGHHPVENDKEQLLPRQRLGWLLHSADSVVRFNANDRFCNSSTPKTTLALCLLERKGSLEQIRGETFLMSLG